jgi:tetratricopeptide (TPR) repeat protein
MKQEINYSRYVDRYLDGVMKTDERIWFEKELNASIELQEEVNIQKKIFAVISDTQTLDLHNQLENIYKKEYYPWIKSVSIFDRSKKSFYMLAGIAATVVILMVIWISSAKNNIPTSELYAEYYQPAEINMSFRTAEDIVDGDLRSAMLYYENRNYGKAIALFEKILKSDKSRIGLNLYSGISYMEINEYAEANKSFRRIIDHKANAFIESAEWYLGLCYIKTGEVNKARQIFQVMASSDGYYKKEARKVLKKLKS